MVIKAVPSMEMVQFSNSGTEACMGVRRLSSLRAVTMATLIHSLSRQVVVLQPSGNLNSLYNDIAPMENPFENNEGEICAIILEPAVENGSFIPRKPEFLNAVRKITKENSALLIFDEVMAGFCLSYGGAQEHFGITPDLTTLGKITGQKYFSLIYDYRSCLLVHMVGREIMEMIAPAGPMYQAGTLSGNPLAMTAGIHSEADAGTRML